MKINKRKCDLCGKEISFSNFDRHYRACKNNLDKINVERLEFNEETNKYICPHCGKEYVKKGIGSHIWRNHTKEGQIFDVVLHKINKEKKSWNKGLTKETSENVKKYSETLKQKYQSGKLVPGLKGKHLSQETRKKLSNIAKERFKQHPEKHPNRLLANNKSKCSYPERIVIDFLNKNQIQYKHQEHILKYYVDFLINDCLIIEIDGEYWHGNLDAIQRDKKRDDELRKLGYCIIRLPAKNIQSQLEILFSCSNKNVNVNIALLNSALGKVINKEQQIKKQQEIKKENEEKRIKKIKERKTLILNSNIDFTKRGCINKLGQLLNIAPACAGRWLKKYMPEIRNNK